MATDYAIPECDPKTQKEYEERSLANHEIFGYGLQVGQSVPCFFCGAKDFMRYPILEMQRIASQPHVCKTCHRSAKMSFTQIQGKGGARVEMRFIQLPGGPPIDHMPWIKVALDTTAWCERHTP